MVMLPIQVTDEGVFIPKTYLHNAQEFEMVVEAEYVLLRPRAILKPEPVLTPEQEEKLALAKKRFPFIGMVTLRDPHAPEKVEEILAREMGLNSLPSAEE